MTRKSDQDLIRAVNEILLKALQDVRLHRIFAKYGIWNETQARRGLETNETASFIGSPDPATDQTVFAELCQIVEEAIHVYEVEGKPLPAAKSGYDWANTITNAAATS